MSRQADAVLTPFWRHAATGPPACRAGSAGLGLVSQSSLLLGLLACAEGLCWQTCC